MTAKYELNLDGDWELTFAPFVEAPADSIDTARASGYTTVAARVPGNVERDLMRAGLLPELFESDNLRAAWELEYGDWWYSCSFELPLEWDVTADWVFDFEGLDTEAEIWLNGSLVGATANMLIPHRLPTSALRPGTNDLVVHISSPMRAALNRDYAPLDDLHERRFEGAWVRKAPHSYGWDISPRLVSTGIWRSVTLRTRTPVRLEEVYLHTKSLDADLGSATLDMFYRVTGWPPGRNVEISVTAHSRTDGSVFTHRGGADFAAGRHLLVVKNPDLWWPRGYGEPALYDIDVVLLVDGVEVDSLRVTTGIRHVEVIRNGSESRWPADANHSDPEAVEDFRVRVNHVDVFLTGTNWVPLDALHSRDAERLESALPLLGDIGGNVVRCWGGNVYEDDAFYNWCDANGVLVWQDFALACGRYPQTSEFADIMSAEARAIIRRLRNHTSIFLWSGNNENDYFWAREGLDPNNDTISRVVLRNEVLRHDPYRTYLPSSPFYSTASFESGKNPPELHLWGARAGFKTPYYADHGAAFVSEIGYHGVPSLQSLARFLPSDQLQVDPANAMWSFHDTQHIPREYERGYNRIQLLVDQAERLFPGASVDMRRFVKASQIAQAEAKKYFVESARGPQSARQSGVIWWNLIDGWPQISDSVVDYYFEKKLAYYYLRIAQKPILVMAEEASGWSRRVVVINNSREDVRLGVAVADLETNDSLWTGEVAVPAGETSVATVIPVAVGRSRCLLMTWTDLDAGVGAAPGKNHYAEYNGVLDLDRYLTWIELMAEGYGLPVEELWRE